MSHRKYGNWLEDGDQQDRWPAFTCPDCGNHHYNTSRKGSTDGGYSTVHCNVLNGCGWVGNYHDYLVPNMEGSSATTAPKELFVQLGLNGAGCGSCKHFVTEFMKTQDGQECGGCYEIDGMNGGFLEEGATIPPDFLCIMWERKVK